MKKSSSAHSIGLLEMLDLVCDSPILMLKNCVKPHLCWGNILLHDFQSVFQDAILDCISLFYCLF